MNVPEWPAVEVEAWIMTPGSVWTDEDGIEQVLPPQYVSRIVTQHKGKCFVSPMVLSLEDVAANEGDKDAIEALLLGQNEIAMMSLKDIVETT